MPSYDAADGCTVLMNDPLLMVALAELLRASSTLHSALVSRPGRGRWMQTMHTELSLDANEALSLASMVRQSCPTARLRAATWIQNRKLWREYGRRPFACGSRG